MASHCGLSLTHTHIETVSPAGDAQPQGSSDFSPRNRNGLGGTGQDSGTDGHGDIGF
jgi:hypothetical protein